jgi:hypothetical protein
MAGKGLAASEEAAAQRRQRKIFPRTPTLTRSADQRTFFLQEVQIVRLEGLKWAFRIAEMVFPNCAKYEGLSPNQILLHASFTKGFSRVREARLE